MLRAVAQADGALTTTKIDRAHDPAAEPLGRRGRPRLLDHADKFMAEYPIEPAGISLDKFQVGGTNARHSDADKRLINFRLGLRPVTLIREFSVTQ